MNTGILNGTYLNTLGTTWSDKIATTEWKIAGNTSANIQNQNAATAYQNEIVTPNENTTINKKVGLMYVTDYGFASSSDNWTTTLISYESDINRNNNWLFLGILEWFISPLAGYDSVVFIVNSGGVYTNNVDDYFGVRPTFYLNSNVMLTSGQGTETNPYRIA